MGKARREDEISEGKSIKREKAKNLTLPNMDIIKGQKEAKAKKQQWERQAEGELGEYNNVVAKGGKFQKGTKLSTEPKRGKGIGIKWQHRI